MKGAPGFSMFSFTPKGIGFWVKSSQLANPIYPVKSGALLDGFLYCSGSVLLE